MGSHIVNKTRRMFVMTNVVDDDIEIPEETWKCPTCGKLLAIGEFAVGSKFRLRCRRCKSIHRFVFI